MDTLEKEMDKITKLLAQAKIEMENASYQLDKAIKKINEIGGDIE